MKLESPKVLSECGEKLVMCDDVGNEHQIVIEKGDYIVVVAGVDARTPSAKFVHPNVAVSCKKIHNFKHYLRGGGKKWTAKPGIDFYFVIPKSQIKILPQEPSSYIKSEINGLKVSFNVSGGTIDGWTDWLGSTAWIGVGLSKRDLKKLAEVAVIGSEMEPVIPAVLDAGDEKHWNRMMISGKVIEKIYSVCAKGERPKLVLGYGYDVNGVKEGFTEEAVRARKRSSGGAYCFEKTGKPKNLIVRFPTRLCLVKLNQIDFEETIKANGWESEISA